MPISGKVFSPAALAWCAALVAAVSQGRPLSASELGGAADIHIDEAWIVPYAGTPAGYATITNASDKLVEIRGVEGPCCAYVSMNRSEGGAHRSIPVKAIGIKPHSTLAFKGSWVHFLLHDLKVPLGQERQLTLTLRFADGSKLAVPFEIRRAPAKSSVVTGG